LPNLLRYLEDRRKKKRQEGIQDVLLKLGQATIGDFMLHLPSISESQIVKAVGELHRDGMITPHGDATGQRTIWMFKIHPDAVSPRWHGKF